MVTTERLLLRQVQEEDADFLVALTNDPDFLRFIGDRSIRTRDDAIAYLRTGPFLRAPGLIGLCVVVGKSSGRPLGVCGLLQREGLADVDLGFAFLPEHRGHGYAFEAASALLQYGARRLQLSRVVAIVDPANERSIALLGKLGMRFERALCLAPDDKLLPSVCDRDVMLATGSFSVSWARRPFQRVARSRRAVACRCTRSPSPKSIS